MQSNKPAVNLTFFVQNHKCGDVLGLHYICAGVLNKPVIQCILDDSPQQTSSGESRKKNSNVVCHCEYCISSSDPPQTLAHSHAFRQR